MIISDGKISWDPRSHLLWNPSPPTTKAKQHLFVTKKNTKTLKEKAPAPKKPSRSHFHYEKSTELGPAGHLVTSLDSPGSVGPAGLKLGLSI